MERKGERSEQGERSGLERAVSRRMVGQSRRMIGRIEMIVGPMFSGKTEELMRRLRREEIAGRPFILCKSSIDNRFTTKREIISRDGKILPAEIIYEPYYLNSHAKGHTILGIDEIQFLEYPIINEIRDFADGGRKIIATGLDMTFRKEPFGIVPALMAIADSVTKLTAVCHQCGEEAIYTQRLIDGKPASFDGPTVQVGDIEAYEARCRRCFRRG